MSLLWECPAHVDAILCMHVYSSPPLSLASSSSAPPPLGATGLSSQKLLASPFNSSGKGDEAATSSSSPSDLHVMKKTAGNHAHQNSPPSQKNGTKIEDVITPTIRQSSPNKPSNSARPTEHGEEAENTSGQGQGARTPWILTVGEADKTVKTWNHAGAPLGKLSRVSHPRRLKKKTEEKKKHSGAVFCRYTCHLHRRFPFWSS